MSERIIDQKNRVVGKHQESKECFMRLHNLVNLSSHASFKGHRMMTKLDYVVVSLKGISLGRHS